MFVLMLYGSFPKNDHIEYTDLHTKSVNGHRRSDWRTRKLCPQAVRGGKSRACRTRIKESLGVKTLVAFFLNL